jgi:hypothetical protein
LRFCLLHHKLRIPRFSGFSDSKALEPLARVPAHHVTPAWTPLIPGSAPRPGPPSRASQRQEHRPPTGLKESHTPLHNSPESSSSQVDIVKYPPDYPREPPPLVHHLPTLTSTHSRRAGHLDLVTTPSSPTLLVLRPLSQRHAVLASLDLFGCCSRRSLALVHYRTTWFPTPRPSIYCCEVNPPATIRPWSESLLRSKDIAAAAAATSTSTSPTGTTTTTPTTLPLFRSIQLLLSMFS